MRRYAMFAVPALMAGSVLAWGAAQANDGDVLYVRGAMQQEINAATNELWDVGNNAMNDSGGLDPAQMDEAKWARLEKAALALKLEADKMATAGTIRAAAPGQEKVEEPGAYSMEDVQSYIDANPQSFRDFAAGLAKHAQAIAETAKARDAENAGLLVGEIDQVCEACHAKYWYPQG
ncbi:cytochrome c [Altererythrobacter sp. CC-YST694]|uniref:cytochrome c n=1 Tax=Altererythrobacter sp. CC-YST694 TaxID=2755038 RepID=UPI001D00F0E1|nr:cytochrome c [Altererythrobacter sp. CC-YST694]MCB5426603.1 cytochrome c [Altererythrobacter sp. CC-YST694]